jgi:hypothetical protein
MLNRGLEITFVLIVLFLILSRARAFSTGVSALGRVYVAGVKALQGR